MNCNSGESHKQEVVITANRENMKKALAAILDIDH